MINGKSHTYVNKLHHAFASGFINASKAFSSMVNDTVSFSNFHQGVHALDPIHMSKSSFCRTGTHIVITTEIFGDVSGKSYLLMSEHEFQTLTRKVPTSNDSKVNFKEEFMKELDNILSASVITHLSNELHCKMYGDIPILIGKTNDEIQELIVMDFKDQTKEIYMNSAFFSFESHPEINPFFIWVMESKMLSISEAALAKIKGV